MLVISRSYEQKLRIGDEIEIMVVDIRPTTVRLGVTAPRHLNILRDELVPYEHKQWWTFCGHSKKDGKPMVVYARAQNYEVALVGATQHLDHVDYAIGGIGENCLELPQVVLQ